MTDATVLAISVAIYTAAIVLVGVWRGGHGGRDREEYYLGGRSLGAWLSAFSGAASSESGWVLLGLVGTAYASGIGALWLIPGCLAGYLFNWFVVGPRLRRASAATGAVTVPQVLATRGDSSAGSVRVVAGLIILAFMATYVAAQFNAVGKALNAMFALEYEWGVAVGLAIVFAYVISGGFRASVWTDLLQASLMVVVLLVFPVGAFIALEPDAADTLIDTNGLFDLTAGNTGPALIGFFVGWVGIGIAYPGQPQVLVRFMATKDDREMKRAGIIATVWSTLVFLGAIASGLVIRAWIPDLDDAEQALPTFAVEYLPGPIAGLILAAVLAAICSTADSQLLVASSVVDADLMGRRSGDRRVRTRVILVVIGISAALLAATENRVVFEFVLYAWAGLGASIGPAVIGRLLWPRTSNTGLVAGMLGGVATVVIWKSVPSLSEAVYELVPGFIVGMLLVRFARPLPRGR